MRKNYEEPIDKHPSLNARMNNVLKYYGKIFKHFKCL